MKKHILSLVVISVFAVLAFSSCKTISYQARGLDIENQTVVSTQTVVDIRVDLSKRVTYVDQKFVKYSSNSMKKTEEQALAAAKYKCITENNIDVVVDPVYKITFKGKNKAKIELTGLGGYYENARSMYNDVQSFKDIKMEDVEKYILFNNPELMQPAGAPVNITVPPAGK